MLRHLVAGSALRADLTQLMALHEPAKDSESLLPIDARLLPQECVGRRAPASERERYLIELLIRVADADGDAQIRSDVVTRSRRARRIERGCRHRPTTATAIVRRRCRCPRPNAAIRDGAVPGNCDDDRSGASVKTTLLDQAADPCPLLRGDRAAEPKRDREERPVVVELRWLEKFARHVILDAVDALAKVFGEPVSTKRVEKPVVSRRLLIEQVFQVSSSRIQDAAVAFSNTNGGVPPEHEGPGSRGPRIGPAG